VEVAERGGVVICSGGFARASCISVSQLLN